MAGTTLGLYVTRIFQLLFAAVVLGLGAKLAIDADDAKDDCNNYVPKGPQRDFCRDLASKLVTITAYAAFTGAFGLIDALVGLVAAFISAVPWLVPLVLDAMAAIFFLAGGINSAVKRNDNVCGYYDNNNFCTQYDATTAFMFLGFVASAAAAPLVFLAGRSR